LQGLEKFRNKLIPHVFMSKESFPPGLTSEGALAHAFQFIETWKAKLFDMLSSGGGLSGEVSETSNLVPTLCRTIRPIQKKNSTA
jgi:hypothetical protein